eukprot:COSAG03_NODE_957_length_5178_cov_6.712603_9_plen_124_part_00
MFSLCLCLCLCLCLSLSLSLCFVSIVRSRYEPCAYLGRPDPGLCQESLSLDTPARYAFGELLAGNMQTHEFYLAPPGTDAVRHAPPGGAVQHAAGSAAFASPLNGFVQSLALDAIPIARAFTP